MTFSLHKAGPKLLMLAQVDSKQHGPYVKYIGLGIMFVSLISLSFYTSVDNPESQNQQKSDVLCSVCQQEKEGTYFLKLNKKGRPIIKND